MKHDTARKLIILYFFLFIGTTSLTAFSFEPISQTFSPSGRGATQSFRLEHKGKETLAIQIKMLTREVDRHGNETNEPAGEFFTVYPSQIVMKPQSSQTVKIRWEGKKDLDKELCYRVLVKQLPVDFENGSDGEGGSLKILFKYKGSIYITPEVARPNVKLESVKIEKREDGDKHVQLLFENKGTRHAILDKLEIRLTDARDSEYVFSGEELEGISGQNILPGKERVFSFPLPSDFVEGDIDADFSYQKTR